MSEPSEKKAMPVDPPAYDDVDDLDDLDDLLDDFADEILEKPPGADLRAAGNMKEGSSRDVKADLNKEVSSGVEDLLKDMEIEDPEARRQLEALLSQLQVSDEQDSHGPADFNNVMKETMERVKESGNKVDESIKNESPEDMLNQLLGGLNLGEGGEGGDLDISKLLVDMLEQLSSKEILYEPMKELDSKYPQWIKDNKAKLKNEELDNYEKQAAIVRKIVSIFDAPDYDDKNESLRAEVNTQIELLQSLGQPPAELMGSGGIPGLNFDNEDIGDDLAKDLDDGCKQQ